MAGGSLGVPSKLCGCVGRGNPMSVEVGNETVVIFNSQVQITRGNFFKVADLERKTEVKRRIFFVELLFEIERFADQILETDLVFIASSVLTTDPTGVIETWSGPLLVMFLPDS